MSPPGYVADVSRNLWWLLFFPAREILEALPVRRVRGALTPSLSPFRVVQVPLVLGRLEVVGIAVTHGVVLGGTDILRGPSRVL